MSIRSVFLPHLGRSVKLGRRKPVARAPRLRLASYLLKALPPPPATCDYTGPAQRVLSEVYLNDRYGDCVIACIAHVVGLVNANAGNGLVLFTDQQIIDLYSAIGGYVPGDPSTDRGADEQTALHYWQQYGAPRGSHQIAGYLAVDPHNPQEYRTALWLFENLIYGIPLPDSWLTNPQPGFVWDAGAPNQNNGHCVAGCGYTSQGVQVATWGMVGTITDAAHARDVEELYVVLTPESISRASQKAPNGFDWSQLVADFDALGGNVPSPSPVPPTPVPPVPVPPSPSPVPPSPVPAPSGPTMQQILACGHDVFNRLRSITTDPYTMHTLSMAESLLVREITAVYQQYAAKARTTKSGWLVTHSVAPVQ